MGLKEWAEKAEASAAQAKAKADSTGVFEGVIMRNGQLSYKQTSGPIAGAVARVESGADIRRRVTATRLVTTGVFAFALKKQKGHVFLTVEHPDYEFVVEIKMKKEAGARKFATKINNAAKQPA